MVLMIVASSMVLGHFVAVTDIPDGVADWVVRLPIHRHVIMSLIFFIYLIGGSVIDDLAFMILATPIFFPAITSVGVRSYMGVHHGLPDGLYRLGYPARGHARLRGQNITKVPMGVIYSGVYPFLIALVICVMLLFAFPALVLYVPSVFMK